MTPFAQHFGLRDTSRVSFELDPDHDAATLFVDLDGLEPRVEEALKAQAPKLVYQGEIGTGKTHILRFIEYRLAPQQQKLPIYIELGGFGKKSNFRDLYIVVMARIEQTVTEALRKLQSDQIIAVLKKHGHGVPDIDKAFRELARPDHPERSGIRAWLLGIGPTPTQARRLGFASRLFDFADPATLINIWKLCGEIVALAHAKRLLLLVDEGEVFSRVTDPDSQAHIGAGLRNLFDPANQSIGCIFGINTPDVRQGVHPFERSDLASRVSPYKVMLQPLEGPDRIRLFYETLWRLLSTLPELLSPPAVRLLSQQAVSMHAAISTTPRVKAVTQRKVVQILDYIGRRAMETTVKLPISDRDLRGWFNLTT